MTTTTILDHRGACPADRIEITEHAEAGVRTAHCLDCGAHQAFRADGTPIPAPTATGPFAGFDEVSRLEASMEPAPKNGPKRGGRR